MRHEVLFISDVLFWFVCSLLCVCCFRLLFRETIDKRAEMVRAREWMLDFVCLWVSSHVEDDEFGGLFIYLFSPPTVCRWSLSVWLHRLS